PKTSVAKPGQTVVVRKGDTIYALARIHDITPADLIAWNSLDNPSTIYPGQVITCIRRGPAAAAHRPPWSPRRAAAAARH
uniref:LysM peptidoglycan-binding domain-containing protein n=1 Tax=Enterobacter hormaechei TaxID=158836 RepID=UPI00203E4189